VRGQAVLDVVEDVRARYRRASSSYRTVRYTLSPKECAEPQTLRPIGRNTKARHQCPSTPRRWSRTPAPVVPKHSDTTHHKSWRLPERSTASANSTRSRINVATVPDAIPNTNNSCPTTINTANDGTRHVDHVTPPSRMSIHVCPTRKHAKQGV